MKKVFTAFILATALTTIIYAQEELTLSPQPQKEAISLPITQAPVQTTPPSEDSLSNTPPAPPKNPKPKESPTKKPTQDDKKPSKKEQDKPDQKLLQEKESAKPKKVIFIQEEFYEPKKNEISLEKKGQGLFLNIHSKELQKFMEGAVYQTKEQVQTFALEDSFTQITNINGKIYEYKYAQKSIDRYSAIAPYQNYALKKITANQYQIFIHKIPQIFDIKGCKIVIKKELSGTLNQRKEVIINLDTKRDFRNRSHFDLFLECPK